MQRQAKRRPDATTENISEKNSTLSLFYSSFSVNFKQFLLRTVDENSESRANKQSMMYVCRDKRSVDQHVTTENISEKKQQSFTLL